MWEAAPSADFLVGNSCQSVLRSVCCANWMSWRIAEDKMKPVVHLDSRGRISAFVAWGLNVNEAEFRQVVGQATEYLRDPDK
jgi:hypothetical protein